MKNEKGLTLLSLIVYVLIMTLVIVMLSTFTGNMYSNLGDINTESYSAEEFNKFNLNFVKDVKKSKDANISTNGDNVKIILENNSNYNYIAEEKAIYRNNVKIANNIKSFSASTIINNNKKVLKVTIGTGKDNVKYGKTINYVLKYW